MDESCYVGLGCYIVPEARLLLDAFVKENVRFDIARDERLLKNIYWNTPPLARNLRGNLMRIAIIVHEEDMDKACRIREEVLSIET